uniref:Uncharacterized protein n=1 Tax=Heterorhabditis bacteriophora TaxID=37862 RepID=A0A1I7WBU7_HETBA
MMFEIDEEILDPLESGSSNSITENPFRFSSSVNSFSSLLLDATESTDVDSPTTVQRNLCLNATSALAIDISDEDEDLSPSFQQKKLCLCASLNPKETQEQGQRSRKSSQSASFPYHTHQITEDYRVSHEVPISFSFFIDLANFFKSTSIF